MNVVDSGVGWRYVDDWKDDDWRGVICRLLAKPYVK